jgi:hypothetical protein
MKKVKRVVAIFVLTLFMGFFIVANTQMVITAKADVIGDIIQAVVTTVAGTGLVIAPEAVVLIAGAAVLGGASFNNTVQFYNFVKGFVQWCNGSEARALGVDYKILGTLAILGLGHTAVTLSPALMSALKAYIVMLKGSVGVLDYTNLLASYIDLPANSNTFPVVSLVANTVYTGFSASATHVDTANYNGSLGVEILLENGLTSGSFMSLVDVLSAGVSSIESFYISEIDTFSNSLTIHAWYGGNVTTNVNNIAFPFDYPLNIINHYRVPVSANLNSLTSISNTGVFTGVADIPISGDGAISLDKPLVGTFPVAVPIPSAVVVGQTAGTLTGALTDAIPAAVIANPIVIPANPTYDLPTTGYIDWSPLSNITLLDKFPFCLPWDVKNLVSSLVAPAVAPVFNFDIPMDALHVPNIVFSIDFNNYRIVVDVIYWGLLLITTVGLIFSVSKIIKH